MWSWSRLIPPPAAQSSDQPVISLTCSYLVVILATAERIRCGRICRPYTIGVLYLTFTGDHEH